MIKDVHLSPCDLAEVFSQLERADDVTLRSVQIELARMQKDRERLERDQSMEARQVKGRGLQLGS
jgi:hypothetical protein